VEQYPDWLSATLASDASEGRGVLPDSIRALWPGSRAVGPAFVVQASRDDNLAVSQAVAAPISAGSVLVVSGHSTSRCATVGGLVALELKNLGTAALITDGLIRDSQEINEMELPVWCRGTTPAAPSKRGPSAVGGSAVVGGVLVRDGDLVIADDDGVVVWPGEDITRLLAQARAKLDADNERLARIRSAARS
jgi:regulator of RNase E activity RraA